MGKAIAGRLVAQGHDVIVWNRSPNAVDQLAAEGATPGSAHDVLKTGLVFSILSNEDAVFDVFAPEVLAGAPAGTVHANMVTVSESAATVLSERHRIAGVGYVAAPVLGRSTAAEQGELSILAAEDSSAIEAATPYLSAMSRRIWNFGENLADANVVKISANLLIIHALQAISESVTLLEHREINTLDFLTLLSDSLFPGPVYSGYGRAIAEHRYQPAGFTIDLGFKDLNLALDAAAESATELPTGAVLRDIFEQALADGAGQLDWSSLSEVTRARSAAMRRRRIEA